MAESDTILQLGIEAAREGNREEARNLFGLLTRQEPDNVQAWLWLAGVAEGPEQRRAALERVVELDPTNEMATKGLQAMGVTSVGHPDERASVSASTAAPPPPPAPSRAMTDEERYAAELDSAFDDYDALPRTEMPPRPAMDEEGDRLRDTSVGAGRSSGRATARERSAARRSTTPIRSSTDIDDDLIAGRPRRGPLFVYLVSAIALISLIFLAYYFIFRRGGGTQVAGGGDGAQIAVADQTATADAFVAGVFTPTNELNPTPTLIGSSEITPTVPLTSTVAPEATAATAVPVAPTAPPAADVSAANPAPVPIDTQLSANGWTYTYPNLCAVSCAVIVGPQGSFTAQGTFVSVLVSVANNTGTDQPLPANFFVLKDAQGRVYEAKPQVSSAYLIRGLNADISQEDAVPANGVLTSMPLVFDVQHGATNLVLFARGKTDQGWQVLNAVP
jgi:hypothetical protein